MIFNLINWSKYGFTRLPEQDFGKCKCYKVGRVTLYITKFEGKLYLSVRVLGGGLTIEEETRLSYYPAVHKLNDTKISHLRKKDIIELHNACVKYQHEYMEAENKINYPTIEELRNRCIEIRKVRQQEVLIIYDLISKVAVKLLSTASVADYISIKEDLNTLIDSAHYDYDPEEYPAKHQRTSSGRYLMKSKYELEPSSCFERLKRKLEIFLDESKS